MRPATGFGESISRLSKKTVPPPMTPEQREAMEVRNKAMCRTAGLDAARSYPLLTGDEGLSHGILDPVFQTVSIIMFHFPHADRVAVQKAVEARYAKYGLSQGDEDGGSRRFARKPVKGSSNGFGLGTP